MAAGLATDVLQSMWAATPPSQRCVVPVLMRWSNGLLVIFWRSSGGGPCRCFSRPVTWYWYRTWYFGYFPDNWHKNIGYFQSCRNPESSDIRESLIQDVGAGSTLVARTLSFKE